MDYVFRVQEDGIDSALKYARKYALRDGDRAWLAFGETNLKPKIIEDYFSAEGEYGDIYFTSVDFTPEIISMIIELNPDLVTKEVLIEVVQAFINKEDKSKD